MGSPPVTRRISGVGFDDVEIQEVNSRELATYQNIIIEVGYTLKKQKLILNYALNVIMYGQENIVLQQKHLTQYC